MAGGRARNPKGGCGCHGAEEAARALPWLAPEKPALSVDPTAEVYRHMPWLVQSNHAREAPRAPLPGLVGPGPLPGTGGPGPLAGLVGPGPGGGPLVVTPLCPDTGDILDWRARGLSTSDSLTAAIEAVCQSYMRANCIPNGAVTVFSPKGALVYCKGLTLRSAFPPPSSHPEADGIDTSASPFDADRDSRFRIASLSKVFTALAVLKLAEGGAFGPVFGPWGGVSQPLLQGALGQAVGPYLPLLDGDSRFPRSTLYDATIDQLLSHQAGICEDRVGNWGTVWLPTRPMSVLPVVCNPGPVDNDTARSVLGISRTTEVMSAAMARWIGVSTTWGPGWFGTYANGGYILLGELIRNVSGTTYPAYVRQKILAPLGMSSTVVGDSHIEYRKEREVSYYANAGRVWDDVDYSVLDHTSRVLRPYGQQDDLRQGASTGGWVTTAADMARLIRSLFYSSPGLLSSAGRAELARARYCWNSACSTWGAGGGFDVRLDGTLNKAGDLSGTTANLCHFGTQQSFASGATCFYTFNRDPAHTTLTKRWFANQLFAVLGTGITAVNWGTDDAFGDL